MIQPGFTEEDYRFRSLDLAKEELLVCLSFFAQPVRKEFPSGPCRSGVSFLPPNTHAFAEFIDEIQHLCLAGLSRLENLSDDPVWAVVVKRWATPAGSQ